MQYKHLIVSKLNESVLEVSLNRPDKRNALSLALMEEISFAFEELQKISTHRIVILTAQGKTFCAGLDLQEASDPHLIEKIAQHVTRLLTSIYTSPLITIAAIQGDAVAGGAGIVAACDCAVMCHEARIGFPEVKRGLIAAQVATLLCRQIPMRDVRELLLFGELISSDRALQMHLVNKIVERDALLTAARTMADEILKGAPEATKDTKRLLDRLDPANFFEDLETALSFHQSARHSEEAKEGISAFLEKRQPKWVNADENS